MAFSQRVSPGSQPTWGPLAHCRRAARSPHTTSPLWGGPLAALGCSRVLPGSFPSSTRASDERLDEGRRVAVVLGARAARERGNGQVSHGTSGAAVWVN
jgi:hypothetical protein